MPAGPRTLDFIDKHLDRPVDLTAWQGLFQHNRPGGGTTGMKLVERHEPKAPINDVIVQIHASGFVPTELTWPSTWTDRLDRDRTPTIPGHELAGVVTALGYGTTGLSVGQRVLGLADWYRDLPLPVNVTTLKTHARKMET